MLIKSSHLSPYSEIRILLGKNLEFGFCLDKILEFGKNLEFGFYSEKNLENTVDFIQILMPQSKTKYFCFYFALFLIYSLLSFRYG